MTSYHFFKIITQENLSQIELELPRRFVSLHGGSVRNRVRVKTHCGSEWSMKVVERDGRMWLSHGWPRFADHFSLEFGHLLFFRYKGDSAFKVTICDVSTCQTHDPRDDDHDDHDDHDDQPEFMEKSLPRLSPPSKKMRTTAGKSSICGRKSREHRVIPPLAQTKNVEASLRGNGSGTEPRNPFFIRTLLSSAISRHYFELRSKFWKKYLKSTVGDILLCDSEGNTWPVQICVRESSRPRPYFDQMSWKEFAVAKNLVVGNECTFELVNVRNKVSLKVSVSPSYGI